MQNDRLRNYLHLHFIVFVWGFTAVLGKLVSIDALPLVWFRMSLATIFILTYILLRGFRPKVGLSTFLAMLVSGIVISLHWLTFFEAIKVSNVSIALATMSSGALFAALLEPLWYKRKIIWYEIVFGIIVMGGLYIIFKVETRYAHGILLALLSAFLASIFSLINGKLVHYERPSTISFYEMASGVAFLSVFLVLKGSFGTDLFYLSLNDWFFILILASVCTAYAFIASVKVMRFISPYTVMLTTNLEPVYGIILAFLILGDTERMNPLFYLGAMLILATVIGNGVLKNRTGLKKTVVD